MQTFGSNLQKASRTSCLVQFMVFGRDYCRIRLYQYCLYHWLLFSSEHHCYAMHRAEKILGQNCGPDSIYIYNVEFIKKYSTSVTTLLTIECTFFVSAAGAVQCWQLTLLGMTLEVMFKHRGDTFISFKILKEPIL